MVELAIGAVSAVVVAALVILLLGSGKGGHSKKTQTKLTHPQPKRERQCPLCSADLAKGQNIKSVLYPKSPGAPDRLMEIKGCPYCYPAPGKRKRICPVCGKEVPYDGDIIARVFDSGERRHVHVLGCSDCYRRKKDAEKN
ncbi:hypothetical protein [Sediminispirochaeta smaragdinae]|jgi:hypothetical protein|uniref:Uncharacterized protein n=1 Tax=Sediminispirochaeta smaragdinae (strain DSM 11293 / JCM 15392 / SEBR 4228) TaxID=573413 RepID=E1RAH9_SEDSS|nr:hypothetical protein [Sediminispirochaeta smaragdinae]ADK79470.1 conserved hypothetical protein [Sediminispirochaeta smaragdinae DSM 11293]